MDRALGIEDAIEELARPEIENLKKSGQIDDSERNIDEPQSLQQADDEEDDSIESTETGEELEDDFDDSQEELDDDSEEDLEDDPDSDEELFDVNGEKLTLSELTSGYMKDADYRKKTESLSQERKKVDELVSTVEQRLRSYDQGLEAVEEVLKSFGPQDPGQEYWDNLRRTNPAEYSAQRQSYNEYSQKFDALKKERARVAQEIQAQESNRVAKALQAEGAKLLEAIPEWKDPVRAEKERTSMRSLASKFYDFSDDELKSIADHRAVLVLRDAVRYRKMMNKRKGNSSKRSNTSVTRTRGSKVPRSQTPKAVQKAGQRFSDTPTLDNAVDLLASRDLSN